MWLRSMKGAFISIGLVFHKAAKDTGSFRLSPSHFITWVWPSCVCLTVGRVIAAALDILSTSTGMRRKGSISGTPVLPTRRSKKSPRICSPVTEDPPSLTEWNSPFPAPDVYNPVRETDMKPVFKQIKKITKVVLPMEGKRWGRHLLEWLVSHGGRIWRSTLSFCPVLAHSKHYISNTNGGNISFAS